MTVIIFSHRMGAWCTRRVVQVLLFLVFLSEAAFAQHPAGWLYTQGNKIYRSDGTIFTGRGANIFDTRLNNAGAYNPPNVAEVNRRTDEIVDVWGADFLRLCLESNASLDEWQVHGLSVLEDTAYLNDIVEIVEHIGTKQNVYVLVSVWVDPSIDDMGWPTDQTIQVWRLLTQRLAQYPYVLFGICNEPQNNYDGSLDSQVWLRMDSVVSAIREEEANLSLPQHIITAQGTGGWARFLQYYVTHPVTAGGGTNIAYEVHVYDSQSEFQTRFITPSQDIPVVIGEFGPAEGYMTLEECQTLMDTAEALQVPYLAWSFHQRAPPNLLVDPTGSGPGIGMELNPTQWGQLLKDQLLSFGAPRIRYLQASPSSISNNKNTNVIFSATVKDMNGSVDSVIIDLTQLGGGSNVLMSNAGGDVYTASCDVSVGIIPGIKTVTVKSVDNQGNHSNVSTTVLVIAPAASNKVIYTDAESLIKWIWDDQGTLSEVSSGAFEGARHYQFTYSFANWWAGYGLHLTNQGAGDGAGYDFTGYKSLQIACSITGSTTASIALIDADGSSSSTAVTISGANGSYQLFTIPLTSFTGMILNDVGEIMVNINGASSSGSGIFNIDNICLLAENATSTDNGQTQNPSQFALYQNFPNPFNPSTLISYQLPVGGRTDLKIYDMLGREIITLVNGMQTAGEHTVEWDGRNSDGQQVGSGVYFYQLNTETGFTKTQKMILLQ